MSALYLLCLVSSLALLASVTRPRKADPMTITPARITEIRNLMDSEFRTHEQLDAVVDELLTDAERTPTDPTADHLRAIADLRAALDKSVTLLRTTADRLVIADAEHSDLLYDAAREMVDVLHRTS